MFEIAPPAADTELGHQNRADKCVAHGGIPVSEFIDETMAAIESDTLEAPIVNAKNIREQCQYLFDRINRP
ncbi:MAG: hypothetical protein ISS66_16650 [Desulfobacteraceae bacterium]|nr:hypothetical protein [Desulfobacteraceae bacterium]